MQVIEFHSKVNECELYKRTIWMKLQTAMRKSEIIIRLNHTHIKDTTAIGVT